jgi:N-acetylglucosamine-6-phosphate deacetylase
MRPVHHREPGPIVALLGAEPVVCELIADGVHLHDGMLGFAARAAPGRTVLVTDAMAAAGMPDGRYELGGQSVMVSGRVARLATVDGSPGTIAGSTLTMDAALRRTVGAGVPLVDSVQMAATTPARVLGLAGTVGALAPGLRADLVELDADLRVVRVMRAGSWVSSVELTAGGGR